MAHDARRDVKLLHDVRRPDYLIALLTGCFCRCRQRTYILLGCDTRYDGFRNHDQRIYQPISRCTELPSDRQHRLADIIYLALLLYFLDPDVAILSRIIIADRPRYRRTLLIDYIIIPTASPDGLWRN